MIDFEAPEPTPSPMDATNALAPELPFDEIWTEEPESKLVVPKMGIAPGPVHLVAGTWYTGKTLFLLNMGLCVASGKSMFGLWGTKRGKWVHFDHEMGRRHIKRYIQRLARGLHLDPEVLRETLSMRVLPQLNLLSTDAVDHYSRLLEKCSLATIDPLRSAAPGEDENNSDFREHLDRLAVVSDRTGCSIMMLHHGGKATEGVTRRNTGRGSSAIDDSVQSKFVLSAQGKKEPIHVSHEKTRELDGPMEDFYMRIDNDEEARSVVLTHLEPEQLEAIDPLHRVKESILRTVAMARSDLCSRNAVAERVAGRRGLVLEAMRELFEAGLLVQAGPDGPIRRASPGSQNMQ